MKFKRFAAILLVLGMVVPAAWGLAATAAMDQVQQTVDGVIATLRDKGMESEARRQKLTGLIRARFDFETMSQWVLGPAWRKADTTEKSRFIALFSDLLEATYLGRIEAYTDEKVSYAGEKVEGERAQIDTFVLTAGADIPITYKLVLRGDQWLVYDVIIEEISLVRNYRSTYNEIIRREGMSGLFTRMEEKIRELKATEGQG
ncbi:toluene tolerance protein [Desulfuromonas versatilis]|uniref:Toluene tolerance protein n=1 Tax=Desulfuromonas versatilis TaxID=2802975 RepID=A0ABN6DZQ8_9BACT|nr:ABC transporter substrate-binding protein [Desulfuromonas versatilis]BCR05626.1 toluene tolerance protein [Desulfuromonas versatilis]